VSLAEFFSDAEKLNVRLKLPVQEITPAHFLNNEALFQLPLLAMTILAITRGGSKPLVPQIGELVGECLERTVVGFKGSSQYIGWSANLRIRTIKALTFLETTDQVIVDVKTRRISATDLGRNIYQHAINSESPLAESMRMIELSYQYINDEARTRGQIK
jgi:hypothetical protein